MSILLRFERDDHGHRISKLERRVARVESVGQTPFSPCWSPIPPPQGLHQSREPSLVGQAELAEEVVLLQGLGTDVMHKYPQPTYRMGWEGSKVWRELWKQNSG